MVLAKLFVSTVAEKCGLFDDMRGNRYEKSKTKQNSINRLVMHYDSGLFCRSSGTIFRIAV